MNRGGSFQSSLVQQIIMEGGGHSWWNMNNLSSSPSSTSSSSILPDQYPQVSNLVPWHENQDLPDSWSQLLLGGLVGEEERCSFTPLQAKQIENMEYQFVYPSLSLPLSEVKHENSEGGYGEMLEARSWSKTPPASSTRSCITNSLSSNMLDFSNNKAERRSHQPDHSSESNSTAAAGSTFKKARVQGSSAQSTCKVRKEKLGDRITALHQIVSPFGKTDTASVLLEAIGYIRFLQNQIEALSSPYLGCGSGSIRQPAQGERSCIFPDDPGQLLNDPNSMKKKGVTDQDASDGAKRDLRSRGLCLVPVSCTTLMHVSSDLNGADYWAPTLGGGFL